MLKKVIREYKKAADRMDVQCRMNVDPRNTDCLVLADDVLLADNLQIAVKHIKNGNK